MSEDHRRAWPWAPRTALVASLLLVLTLLSLLVLLDQVFEWPGAQARSWMVVGLVVLALVPIVLTIVDVLAERGGKVATKWGSIEFDAVETVTRAPPTFEVPENIEQTPHLADTGSETLHAMLRASLQHEVIEVDIGSGRSWWLTRLFFVAAVAATQHRPSAIVLVCTEARKSRSFIGWAHPADIRDAILRDRDDLRTAHDAAVTDQTQAGFAQRLGRALQPLESTPPPRDQWVNSIDVRRLLDPFLWKETVDRQAAVDEQLHDLLMAEGDYVAVTDGREFRGLQRTDRAARELLLHVLRSQGGAEQS